MGLVVKLTPLTSDLAPLPNALFPHRGSDELSTLEDGPGPLDLGRFITSTVVVTGFALPLVLANSDIIRPGACTMPIIDGGYVFPSPHNYFPFDSCMVSLPLPPTS